MAPMRRRTLLGIPALGVAGLALAACGDDEPMTETSSATTTVVPYGDDPSQFAELTLPAGTPRGVVVVIHGGFWLAAYGLELGRPLAQSLAAEGWAAWNLEYRRVGNGGGTPATFDDVDAGIDKLADLDLDLERVVTLGHSAGGHLATWAASRGRFEEWSGGVEVTGVISQAGVLDLQEAHRVRLGDGAVEGLLGHAPTAADDRYDPFRQLPLDVPVWCVHGRDDDSVPASGSERYVEAATAAGAAAELLLFDGDHFVVVDTTSEAWAGTLGVLDGLG